MSYLKFDKNLLINLEQSLPKELLRTNKSGAYHCSSLIDCNTRKYHGLLVMPIPELDDDNHVMLSSLDETVVQHGAEFNLGIHKFQGDIFSPKGHKYIREFDCDCVPRTIYRVGGVILSKEKVFVSHENRILIKYTLLQAHSQTTLRFRPFLAFRNVNELMHENEALDQSYNQTENGIDVCLYPGYPRLFMQMDKTCKFVYMPDWYRNIEYLKEQERGYDYKEDLYIPGYFEFPIQKGESVIFSAGINEINTTDLSSLYEQETQLRTRRTSFYNCLKNSAQQFQNKKDNKNTYLLAGYPWFKVRARDLFIALPGASLAIDDQESFETIMDTASIALKSYMEKGQCDPIIKEIEHPDVLLWCLWALQQYAIYVSPEQCRERYGPFIRKIINYILKGNHANLFVHNNGLIYSYGKEKAISWMNSSVNNRPVVPRSGYLVEFNALWYNAICFIGSLFKDTEFDHKSDLLHGLVDKTKNSFLHTFLNQHGYLYDYVDGNYADFSVRPNMLFAISLPFSPLSKRECKGVLDVVTRELLTPKGVRSLSPKSMGYNPIYCGTQLDRDYAYHQGTAWPWLMGAYSEAYLKLYGLSGISFIERMLIGFEEEMSNHCIGSISELFDGNPPFKGRGAISFAINVAEILRVLKILDLYNSKSEKS